jgi:8-oxo-dGTP pyrophosphatase MutT (NUDIX family)
VQLGGHIEAFDLSLGGAARREAIEESGIDGLRLDPVPIGLDRHEVTCHDSDRARSPSVHFDVTFTAVADPNSEPERSAESLDLRWFDVRNLPPGADITTRRLVDAAVIRFAASHH